MHYVYFVTNKHDSVLYIGVTSNLEDAFSSIAKSSSKASLNVIRSPNLFTSRIILVRSALSRAKSN